jgi:hypothetical protein
MSDFAERGALEAFRDSERTVKCGNCIYRTYDMDGNYCCHPESFESSGGFGQGLTLARSSEGFCGPEGKFHE